MTARIPRRVTRLILLLAALAALMAAAAGPAAATEPRPTPGTGGIPTIPLDLEPGGAVPGSIPSALNVYRAEAFRFQDPNYAACTATSALVMLNTIAHNGNGGTGFKWVPRLGLAAVESILSWERTHDTLEGGSGSDPHGWRNALNYYGWGSGALYAGSRVYEDLSYSSYDRAMKNAIRQLIRTRKPVGILAWKGRHAQFITGYAGLKGNPFAKDGSGRYANTFTVDAVYLSDPLKADGWVNARIGYAELGSTANTKLRFAPYAETDSPYDDAYTDGFTRARDEWLQHWVIVAPLR